ncbi:MAG: CcoQ/FixQ family Cbb3-type cytochrome c oxidase assembly chaperone [Flavobacteriales bacterium]
MLKYIKNHLSTMDSIEIYPLISLMIFVIFFVFVTWRVIKMSKERVEVLENLPLTDTADAPSKPLDN